MAALSPCVHGQTPLLTLLSCLLSHASTEGILGEMSQVIPLVLSLSAECCSVHVCVHTQVYRLGGSENNSLMGKLGLLFHNPISHPFFLESSCLLVFFHAGVTPKPLGKENYCFMCVSITSAIHPLWWRVLLLCTSSQSLCTTQVPSLNILPPAVATASKPFHEVSHLRPRGGWGRGWCRRAVIF